MAGRCQRKPPCRRAQGWVFGGPGLARAALAAVDAWDAKGAVSGIGTTLTPFLPRKMENYGKFAAMARKLKVPLRPKGLRLVERIDSNALRAGRQWRKGDLIPSVPSSASPSGSFIERRSVQSPATVGF